MPSIFNVLVCILALLVGVLIGEKYRKWKKVRDEKKIATTKNKRTGLFPVLLFFSFKFY